MRQKSLLLLCLQRRNLLVLGLLLGTGLFTLSAVRHEYHVSVTQVDYNAEVGSLEIAVKIFTNDLETALESLGAPPLKLGSDREYFKADSIIARYLNNRLHFVLNGGDLNPVYLGKEIDLDATWCYLEVKNAGTPGNIKVRNRILLEQFNDQANLVHFSVGGQKKSMILRKGNASETVFFE